MEAFRGLEYAIPRLRLRLLNESSQFKQVRWQAIEVKGTPMAEMRELLDISIAMPVPSSRVAWAEYVQPNLPWAEDHFQERVSGEPLNPPPSSEWWPWAQANNEQFKANEKFSHTYPERFWPKQAGWVPEGPRQHLGIRYAYGDLNDVVNQLANDPNTRQAYLPVFFPEDTGAVHKERVPCTLGYHFIIRGGLLHTTYYIRSCDFVRHFRDDVYMAGRLGQWVAHQLQDMTGNDFDPWPTMGNLTMHIVSLHCFENDVHRLEQELHETY